MFANPETQMSKSRLICIVFLAAMWSSHAVSPECRLNQDSLECYRSIQVPLRTVTQIIAGIPLKVTIVKAKHPISTVQGTFQIIKGSQSQVLPTFIMALHSFFEGIHLVSKTKNPALISGELAMFLVDIMHLIITTKEITNNPMLEKIVAEITPDLLEVNRNAFVIVKTVGGPRTVILVPMLYLNRVGLNYLQRCRGGSQVESCEFVRKNLIKALEVAKALPVILKEYGDDLDIDYEDNIVEWSSS